MATIQWTCIWVALVVRELVCIIFFLVIYFNVFVGLHGWCNTLWDCCHFVITDVSSSGC